MVHVSEHGEMRAVERLGIPRRSVARMAARAFAVGVARLQTKGELRRYLDAKFYNGRGPTMLRVHGESVYVFGVDGTFVTTWRLPRYLLTRKHAASRQEAACHARGRPRQRGGAA